MPRQSEPKRIACPLPDYAETFVVLPGEFLGRHLVRRTAAVAAAAKWADSQIAEAAIALAVVDEFGGVPGAETPEPAAWDLTATPVPVLIWLKTEVYAEFTKAFDVPKG